MTTTTRCLVILIGLTWASNSVADALEINVGTLIDRVIAGEDFAGQELVLSAVVLDGGSSGSGLLNLGTRETYRSGSFDNYVSVRASSRVLKKGTSARIRVKVKESSAYRIGGETFVIIETVFLECLECQR